MIASFIDEYPMEQGVELICGTLPIAPSTYYKHKAQRTDPAKRSLRQKHDATLREKLRHVWESNFCVYGVRKIWHQLKRESEMVARCTIERLMRQIGLRGVVSGKTKHTTIASDHDLRPLDLVWRVFHADRLNQLWVADFTYVVTWAGLVYVAFAIDVFIEDDRRLAGGPINDG